MKKVNLVKYVVLASVAALSLSTVNTHADELMVVSPSHVYQSTKNVSLKNALDKVASRSGIEFKLSTSVGGDVVAQNLASATWEDAIKSLLHDYNYILVTDKGAIKTVIVTGKSGSGTEPTQVTASVDPLDYEAPIVITPKMGTLPKVYDSYPAGSVMAIDLPIKELMSLGKGKTAPVDTPLGQFNVSHDTSVTEFDGSTTFVGHLTDEGQGYRMILSQGPAGIMGSVVTPEGNFSIENQNGAMVLINNSKLTHAGYEGDTVSPNTSNMGAIVAKAVAAATVTAPTNNVNVILTAAQLAANVSVAQVMVTSDITAVNAATANVSAAQALVTTTTAAVTTANTNSVAAAAAVTSGLATWSAAVVAANIVGSPLNALIKTRDAGLAAYNSRKALSASGRYLTDIATTTTLNKLISDFELVLTKIPALQAASNVLLIEVKKARLDLNSCIATSSSAAATLVGANTALTNANASIAPLKALLVIAQTKLTNDQVTLSAAQSAAKSAGAANVIDIMVEYATDQYTPAFSLQRIAMLVTASNQAYVDSGINATLRLVYTEPTTYSSKSSNSGALAAMSNGIGVFSGVAAARSKYGADLVLLFHPLNAVSQGMNCGIAYIGGEGGTTVDSSQGFAVISDGVSQDTSGRYCDINTFTHEVGHTMGLAHNRENTTIYGATPYSYAWRNQTGLGGKPNFATIMAYGQPIVMYFSTPALAAKDSKGITQLCNGQPCGYAASDTARASDQVQTVNSTAPILSRYMPTMVNHGKFVLPTKPTTSGN